MLVELQIGAGKGKGGGGLPVHMAGKKVHYVTRSMHEDNAAARAAERAARDSLHGLTAEERIPWTGEAVAPPRLLM